MVGRKGPGFFHLFRASLPNIGVLLPSRASFGGHCGGGGIAIKSSRRRNSGYAGGPARGWAEEWGENENFAGNGKQTRITIVVTLERLGAEAGPPVLHLALGVST